jgi:hypothetical protein
MKFWWAIHAAGEEQALTADWTLVRKLWAVHGSDYEECRLVGYEIPFRTSEETHYISATEPSRLMLCNIWAIGSSDYDWDMTQFVPHRKHITS